MMVAYWSPLRLKQAGKQFVSLLRRSSVWTAAREVRSPFEDVLVPRRTVPEHIWGGLERWPDKTAAVCGFTGRQYTYHQLYKHSLAFAVRLRVAFAMRDGDTLCVMLPNVPEMPLVVLGALSAGALVTTVNPIYTAHEVSRQILLSGTKLIVGTADNVGVLKKALELAKKKLPIIIVHNEGEGVPEGTISLIDLVSDDSIDASVLKEVKRSPEDICFLPYSSGTTGLPKGVELTNTNIVANCVQQDTKDIRHYNETTQNHQDNTLVVLPLFHIYGLSILMLHKLSVGSKLVMVPKFHANTFISVFEKEKINLLYAAPPIVLFLGTHNSVRPSHLEHINMLMCAAAPLPLADVHKLFEKAERKLDLLQGYGLTETSPLVTINTRGSEDYGSSGYAIPNTKLKIVDKDLKSLGPNQVGELMVKGPQVMKGYKDNEEATRGVMVDGWFRTGDLASLGEDGSLKIHDRLKELIKVKGFQVPPAELEGVLKEHPCVLEAAVVGAPHERLGEAPHAFVVVRAGQEVSSADLASYVTERVAEYKRIHNFTFLKELPKNPSGKILRRVLKEKYC